MALLELTFCVLIAGGIGRAGQPERASAIRWADYYAAMYHVPPELVHAIIEVESGWQARAISDKGAAGLMQLMPATAVRFGVTNRFEMAQNLQGGVAYLARLINLFDGDLRLVTAAYLTGENRILPALRRSAKLTHFCSFKVTHSKNKELLKERGGASDIIHAQRAAHVFVVGKSPTPAVATATWSVAGVTEWRKVRSSVFGSPRSHASCAA